MRVLILSNIDVGLYKFRHELLEALLAEHHEVHISLPNGEYVPLMEQMGCVFHDAPLNRHGTNPVKELQLLHYYQKLLREVRPDVVLTYTIKPNSYGGLACSARRVPYIATITGLHGAVEEPGLMQKITLALYRAGLRKAHNVFFQNTKNRDFMLKHGIRAKNIALLPGSGVNLDEHPFEEYPEDTGKIVFLIIGRIMKIKGTGEILDAAEIIARDNKNVLFRFVGDYEEIEYRSRIEAAIEKGYADFVGQQDDVHSFIKNSHATIHASYREGMSNVLLESAAVGRPVLATNIQGCIETFDDRISGIAFEPRNVESLVCALRDFLALPYEQKAAMGKAGRKKMEREFDRKLVVEEYLKAIADAAGPKRTD